MKTGKILLAVTGGLVAGATLGILFAPHKGKKTRDNIASGVKKAKDDITAKLEEGAKSMAEMKGQMEDMAKHIRKAVAAD